MVSFSTVCSIKKTFHIQSVRDLDIIKINKCLVAKDLLMYVTKTNEHSNVATFVHALVCVRVCPRGY